jgi:hypothetical protein
VALSAAVDVNTVSDNNEEDEYEEYDEVEAELDDVVRNYEL